MDIETFARSWREGKVCLHPTDTLPGLSFHPELNVAEENFRAVKERPESKRPISLIGDRAMAKRYWQPLPQRWEQALETLWPASLSVIWQAADNCPKALVGVDGTTAFRMPLFSADKIWMQDLLLELNLPFPSSSVNRSGEPAEVSWAGAAAFASRATRDIYVPPWTAGDETMSSLSSTVIRVHRDGSYEVLREGAVLKSRIDLALLSL